MAARRNFALARIAPGSAFRVGLVMALVGFVAWLIAVTLLYVGMSAAGILDSVNSLIGDVGGENVITFGVVIVAAALLGAIFTILMAILAPLGAIIYNSIVQLFGGFNIGLEEDLD
ncbi:MAG TPA: DUF3566 domain-containing protein [Corynebacterium sp.]|nr:DUF3566 domain-containing protein [Corynebacterium sp.]